MKLRYISILAIASIFTVAIAVRAYTQRSTNPQGPISNPVGAAQKPQAERYASGTKHPPVYSSNRLAIKGADPVAYFTESKAVIGSPEFKHEWNGAIWHFASAANRDKFAANPNQYAPEYGGYCAFALSRNYLASVEPEVWTIYEGKLYLNYSMEVQARWSRDIPGNIAKGDGNWPAILNR
ncbi:YHS domain-containing (seleno)protein [Roseofilum casamattae]|uniref:YHS domain-containing (Seleno)protein n=1 Tax=Roseofilum casamattae BLCC-M143 TaxID=3022442 RepID=A0ABT7C1S7_9CYAN|nr:YHS domain-containing (seleno)protein [Roseofilum casamattae]MDJ1185379.1 YHS domain-containing (seleno)protein [Roseofilum casamattae BLCC-M143]